MTETLKNFAESNKTIFWDCAMLEDLSEAKILERTLNFGSLEAVKDLLEIIGKKKSAKIFFLQIEKKRDNYKPQIKKLFKLVFNKYV